jgi:hypothetical protein
VVPEGLIVAPGLIRLEHWLCGPVDDADVEALEDGVVWVN